MPVITRHREQGLRKIREKRRGRGERGSKGEGKKGAETKKGVEGKGEESGREGRGVGVGVRNIPFQLWVSLRNL